ncbi:MAG: helix-turn-helix transcriptional regulator, partial [Actinomycetota bacterium]
MFPWRAAGDILRWWRGDVLDLTQQQAADRLNVQASALSHWERDARAISIAPDTIDEALEGQGVLRSLLWAANTPDGLDPGHLWTKVFPGPSAPVWVWIRSPASKIFLQAEWGVARIDTVLEPGPNGAFITVGASVPDSPVVLYMSEPGWADFGWGELPQAMPGAPVLAAVSMFSASSADGRFMEFFRSHVQAELADPSSPRPRLAEVVPESIERFVADRTRREPVKEPHKNWPVHAEGIDAVDRQRFARLRQARGLSRTEMARRVTKLTDTAVSRDTIRRFEKDVGKPHDPMLPVALDHALGAD